MLNISVVKKEIEDHKVISFDLFDTLLLRPFLYPSDLFDYIERQYEAPGFSFYRNSIESHVRGNLCYDEIYEYIPEQYKYLKKIEIECEFQTLIVNKEILELYDYAISVGKIVVFTSDMYFDRNTIRSLLEKKEVGGFSDLFISCDVKKRKSDGLLFDHVRSFYNVSCGEVFHIGDNKKSDYEIPRAKGIHAFHYESPRERFVRDKRNSRYLSLYRKYPSISLVLGVGILAAQKKARKDYWEQLGYLFGGALVLSFIQEVKRISEEEKIPQILFVARDGYVLSRAFEMLFGTTVQCDYVYLPRTLRMIAFLDWCNEEYLDLLIEHYSSIDNHFHSLFANPALSYQEKKTLVSENLFRIQHIANNKREQLKTYLDSIVKHDSIAIVDSITGSFSSQYILESVYPEKDVAGIYWKTLNPTKFKHFVCCDIPKNEINVHMVEFFLSAPEFPIQDIVSGSPVYKNPTPDDEKLMHISERIAQGELCFISDIKEIFGDTIPVINYATVSLMLDALMLEPTKNDLKMFSGVKHFIDPKNTQGMPFVEFWRKSREKNPWKKRKITIGKIIKRFLKFFGKHK